MPLYGNESVQHKRQRLHLFPSEISDTLCRSFLGGTQLCYLLDPTLVTSLGRLLSRILSDPLIPLRSLSAFYHWAKSLTPGVTSSGEMYARQSYSNLAREPSLLLTLFFLKIFEWEVSYQYFPFYSQM